MTGPEPLTLVVADRILHQLGCGPTTDTAAYTCPRCRTAHLTITANGAGPTLTCPGCGELSAYLQTCTKLPSGRVAGVPGDGHPFGDNVDVLQILRDRLKCPELERIVKHGRRGNSYELHLKGGRVVALGAIDVLISQAKFRAAFIPQVRRNPPRHKPVEWDDVVEMIEQLAEERDAVATIEDETIGWIAGYLGRSSVTRGIDTSNTAAMFELLDDARGDLPPFFDCEGRLHIRLEGVVQWLGRMAGVRVSTTELSARLSALDFERVRLAKRKGDDLRRAWVSISPAGFESDLR